MDSNSLSRFGRTNHHRPRTQQEVIPIVDDPVSSNPHSLLPWLKRRLQTFTPSNNTDYNPTLPPAA